MPPNTPTSDQRRSEKAPPGEFTPLLLESSGGDSDVELGAAASEEANGSRRVPFRRSSVKRASIRTTRSGGAAGASAREHRYSVRLTEKDIFPSTKEEDRDQLEPIDALSPLVAGGIIVATDGYKTAPHPPSSVKSLPAFVPFRRRARHRSFTLWWINQFRHWWKSRYECILFYCRLDDDLSLSHERHSSVNPLQSSFGAIGGSLDLGCDGHFYG